MSRASSSLFYLLSKPEWNRSFGKSSVRAGKALTSDYWDRTIFELSVASEAGNMNFCQFATGRQQPLSYSWRALFLVPQEMVLRSEWKYTQLTSRWSGRYLTFSLPWDFPGLYTRGCRINVDIIAAQVVSEILNSVVYPCFASLKWKQTCCLLYIPSESKWFQFSVRNTGLVLDVAGAIEIYTNWGYNVVCSAIHHTETCDTCCIISCWRYSFACSFCIVTGVLGLTLLVALSP